MNYIELKKENPLTFEKLEKWFTLLYDFPNSEVVVDEYVISQTDGSRFAYLNLRDLYSFFDYIGIKLFVCPADNGMYKFAIQSKKSLKEFDEIFTHRIDAETNGFELCFTYTEILLKHLKENGKL